MKEAEANKVKLSPEYLELRFIEGIASNSKIYFGNKVLSLAYLFLGIGLICPPSLSIYLLYICVVWSIMNSNSSGTLQVLPMHGGVS